MLLMLSRLSYNILKTTSSTRLTQYVWRSNSQKMDVSVNHSKDDKEFFVLINGENGETQKALLQYEFLKPKIVDLYHTEVPPVFRGKGIAKHLAKAALDHFTAEDIEIKLSCSYLQKYIKDNPLPDHSQKKIIS